MPKVIILALAFFSAIAAQPVLKEEHIKGDLYSLQINLENSQYQIINKNGKNYISFNGFIDEQKPGEPALPSKSIFIAIPYGPNPQIKFTNIITKRINAQPFINPQIKTVENKVLYEEYLGAPKLPKEVKEVELKGFLWIGENYCAHLQINEYRYSINEGDISKIESFNAEFKFSRFLPSKSPITAQKKIKENGVFINPAYAASLKSKPVYKTNSDDSWIDYNKTYLKIGIAANGIYRIYPEDLTSNGINISFIDPKEFKLINKGIETPIYVFGEEDGAFDSGDYIEFVGLRNMGGKHREISAPGEPYNEYLGRYSDTTIYWLSWEGEFGKRVVVKDSSIADALGELKYYSEVIHKETNKVFDFSMQDEIEKAMPFWHSAKTWNEGSIGIGEKNIEFILMDVYPDEQARIFSKLQDLASNFYTNAHLLGMTLNSDTTVYDKKYIDKYEQTVLSGTLNSSLLTNGTNILKIHNYNIGNYINSCAFDWSEIEYPRYIKAINDSMEVGFSYISQPGVYKFSVDNFNSFGFSLWKFNQSAGKFTKYNALLAGGKVGIADSISAEDKFIIIRNTGIKKPKIYYAKKMKNLRASSNAAEYVAITHPKFKEMIEDYAAFISESYTLMAKTVLIDDIYDEFSYGYFNPEAIKDFLMEAYAGWNPLKPEYVCLIGSATYDYYGNKNSASANNYVPSYGAPVSDNWFVIWDTTGASYPQLNIGRLPIRTEEEFNRYFEKHQQYIKQDYAGWNKRYVLFSGGRTNLPDELALFKSVNDSLIRNIVSTRPIGGRYAHFYKTIDPFSNYGPYTDEDFNNIIKKGAIAISYLGHSGAQTWDNGISSPSQLKNDTGGYPLITDFGCSTARFAEPDVTSFAEMFTLGIDGQAIQYLGNTSLGVTSTATLFPGIFYNKILSESIFNSGKALNTGKIEMLQTYGELGTYKLFAYTNTVIGDPVINIKIPPKPNLHMAAENITIEPAAPKNSDESVLIKAEYFNYGSSPNDSLFIKAEYINKGVTEKVLEFSRALPLYNDSLYFYIPINMTAGEREIRIALDEENSIEELNESDNIASIHFYIASSYIQSDLLYENEQEISGRIRIFNPSIKPTTEIIEYEMSDNPDFTGAQKYFQNLDTLYTDIRLGAYSLPVGRYWFRAKLQGEKYHSIFKNFYLGNADGFLLNDIASFSSAELNNAHYDNGITIDSQFMAGEMITPLIGPAGVWRALEAEVELNTGTIDLIPIAYLNSGLTDTLPKFELESGSYDLDDYNNINFDNMKFIAALHAGNDGTSPVLKSLRVLYNKPAELYLNYQTVFQSSDTVMQGDNLILNAFIYNAGEIRADSFSLIFEILNAENIVEESHIEFIDSLGVNQKKEFIFSFYARETDGEKRFRISIDPENKVREIFEDNNIYYSYFNVLQDTTPPAVKLKFDGKEIYDNEYVSSEPKIVMEIYNNSLMEINDTSSVNLYLDSRRINYNGNKQIYLNYNNNNPKVIINFSPVLEEGEHTIYLTVKKAAGNYVPAENSSKKFIVIKNFKMLDLYNYPNPASNETYFTFRLSQLPNMLKIKIYTIAGRMIKEIKIPKSGLSLNFNKIYWDCRDMDGDKIGNGVYLYKIISIMEGRNYTAYGKIGIIK